MPSSERPGGTPSARVSRVTSSCSRSITSSDAPGRAGVPGVAAMAAEGAHCAATKALCPRAGGPRAPRARRGRCAAPSAVRPREAGRSLWHLRFCGRTSVVKKKRTRCRRKLALRNTLALPMRAATAGVVLLLLAAAAGALRAAKGGPDAPHSHPARAHAGADAHSCFLLPLSTPRRIALCCMAAAQQFHAFRSPHLSWAACAPRC